MARKRALDDRYIQALRRKGRYEVPDPGCPRLWLRVGPRRIVFLLVARLGAAPNPTRLTLGVYDPTTPPEVRTADALTLAEARTKAERWNAWIDRHLDPRAEETRLAVERAQRLRATFGLALEDYLAHIPGRKHNRQAARDQGDMRRELLDPERNPWIGKPLAEVDDVDVSTLIAAVRDRPAPTSAYNLFRRVKTFFTWAHAPERRRDYYLGPTSPIASLEAIKLELGPNTRDRVLGADEVAAYLAAAAATPYPYGPFYMAMILTGQRENEVAGMRRSEIDMAGRLWTIPAARYKPGRAHAVPLSDQMMELLQALLRVLPAGHGDCLFSVDNGRNPIADFSHPVQAFKRAVLSALREAKPGAEMAPWELEDTRRTVRSGLSRLKVPKEVARAVLGHAKQGLDRVYDLYEYLPEREEALARWGETIADTGRNAGAPPSRAGKPAPTERGRERRR
ncbi:tyrosine-type recombinase/integrase [Rhizobium sullae]|uniref:tyrosine-type recombinase/integrase n=1 Tax=Rhizobium sullae TaxID=50338 RepID=UPI000B35003E|nr:tyrosine-type recombinase/integrase [Rhizobium sullae]